jgi:hypothetical protein
MSHHQTNSQFASKRKRLPHGDPTAEHKTANEPLPKLLPRRSGWKPNVEPQKVVAIWNARQAGSRALWFYPTIGAAIAAGLPWLTFSCPACGQWGSVDLRTLDRRPGAASNPVREPGERCTDLADALRFMGMIAEGSSSWREERRENDYSVDCVDGERDTRARRRAIERARGQHRQVAACA